MNRMGGFVQAQGCEFSGAGAVRCAFGGWSMLLVGVVSAGVESRGVCM